VEAPALCHLKPQIIRTIDSRLKRVKSVAPGVLRLVSAAHPFAEGVTGHNGPLVWDDRGWSNAPET